MVKHASNCLGVVCNGLHGFRVWDFLTRDLQRGQILDVEIGTDTATYSLREGKGLVIRHEDELIRLSLDDPLAKRPISKFVLP